VSEREERRDAGAFVVLVANEETFTVEDLEVLTWPVVPCGRLLDSFRESCLCEVSI
jgi:hypothetical protein